LHGVGVDALVGVLGDEHVVVSIGDQCTQELPLGGAQVLSLVDQDVVGESLAGLLRLAVQHGGSDGAGLVPVEGADAASSFAIGGHGCPDLPPLVAPQAGATPAAGHTQVAGFIRDAVREDHLAVLVFEEAGRGVGLRGVPDLAGAGCGGGRRYRGDRSVPVAGRAGIFRAGTPQPSTSLIVVSRPRAELTTSRVIRSTPVTWMPGFPSESVRGASASRLRTCSSREAERLRV